MALGGPAYTQAVNIAALIKQLGLLGGATMTTPLIPTAAPLIGVAQQPILQVPFLQPGQISGIYAPTPYAIPQAHMLQ